jgi:hypothetical protein
MVAMKVSVRSVVTVLAALVVMGGLVRLSIDKRRVAVSLPDVVDGRDDGSR